MRGQNFMNKNARRQRNPFSLVTLSFNPTARAPHFFTERRFHSRQNLHLSRREQTQERPLDNIVIV
jgi:hypothetical protein